MLKKLSKILRIERGAALVETSLVIVLVAIICLPGIQSFGRSVNCKIYQAAGSATLVERPGLPSSPPPTGGYGGGAATPARTSSWVSLC